LSSSLIVSQVFTVIKRLLRHVVLNGLTSLSEKRHPMMAYSHMDVALWILCSPCSYPLLFQSTTI
ncbi:unnamed protein product, partial [Brassica rapa subsp. narinosa]